MMFCPECLNPIANNCRLPYVCKCTKAILTTRKKWLVPRKKIRARDYLGSRERRIEDSQKRKEERGRQMWRDIHLHTDCNRKWYQAWRERLVKSKCNCGSHFRELERTHPISFESPEAFFESSIVMHNAVNERLGKPQVSIDEAYTLWRHRRPKTDRKRCIVTVAVGYEMLAIHRLTKSVNQAYADRCDADFICLTNQIEPWWGLEKFRTWHFAREYEECLFLDADAIVTPDAPIIFGLDAEVAMHNDYERLRSHDWLRKERSDISRLSGESIRNDSTCYNTGFAYTKRSAADMWRRPDSDIGTSHCAEQIWAEHQAREFQIAELDSRWNWQWWFEGFEHGVSNAWVVHFANAPHRVQKISDFLLTLAK